MVGRFKQRNARRPAGDGTHRSGQRDVRFNKYEGSGGNHGRPVWRTNTLYEPARN